MSSPLLGGPPRKGSSGLWKQILASSLCSTSWKRASASVNVACVSGAGCLRACAVPCVLRQGPGARLPGMGPAESQRRHGAFARACSRRPVVSTGGAGAGSGTRTQVLKCLDTPGALPERTRHTPSPPCAPKSGEGGRDLAARDGLKHGTGGLRTMLGGWTVAGIWGPPEGGDAPAAASSSFLFLAGRRRRGFCRDSHTGRLGCLDAAPSCQGQTLQRLPRLDTLPPVVIFILTFGGGLEIATF